MCIFVSVCVCVLGMRSMISGNVKIVEGAEFHIHIRGKHKITYGNRVVVTMKTQAHWEIS